MDEKKYNNLIQIRNLEGHNLLPGIHESNLGIKPKI